MSYDKFIETKRIVFEPKGLEAPTLNPILFDFQHDLVTWALRKGRCAIFADTGLGKTFMQIEWARSINQPVLILAPLAVAQQTVREAARLDVNIEYVRDPKDATTDIVITNYEIADRFDPDQYAGVVLDESSILKNYTGKTRNALIKQFANTPYRLCCTATPAPNDIAEMANHSEFLGIMPRVDMLATFFVHDDKGWRLKGHATEPFYRWLASWGLAIKQPADLGYKDEGFELPPLTVTSDLVEVDWKPEGQLFASHLKGITERAAVRRDTIDARVAKAAELIKAEPDHAWIAWCGYNDESRLLTQALGGDAVEVEGSQTPEEKARRLLAFQDGEARVLITKPSIAGFGLNFQHCARVVFVGINDSYEQFYQAVRRCYRFGQTRPVEVHIVASEPEQSVVANVQRKEQEAEAMTKALIANLAQYEIEELAPTTKEDFVYREDVEKGDGWELMLGDSCERLTEVADGTIGFSVFSPPFESLYTYTATERDLGNSGSSEEFWDHFSFISEHLLRVLMPGRLAACHVQQLPTIKSVHGFIGLRDFRGDTIRHFVSQGFIYHGEICIDKDPQAQAIRTKAKSLMFVQLEKDSSWMRPAFADYILLFRKPGDNPEPIDTDVTRDEWIQWARPIWYNIRETETLNVREARTEKDERHIAPLQLETIRRCLKLWSNHGDTVLSPFAGIGSEGFESILNGRRFVGIELKPEYYETAIRNLHRAEQQRDSGTLFDLLDVEEPL
jgi:DNA modification methylase/superfamily II DNA or RNA helicase